MNSTSLKKLKTCDDRLIKLAMAIDEVYPIQVICGHRNKEDQDEAFKSGNSKLEYPNSKHNSRPSMAMDLVPDPDHNPKTISWADLKAFDIMLLVAEQKAADLGIKIRLGRDFKMRDYPHVELE